MKKKMKKHKAPKKNPVNIVIILSVIALLASLIINNRTFQLVSAAVLLISLIIKFVIEAKPEDTERGAC